MYTTARIKLRLARNITIVISSLHKAINDYNHDYFKHVQYCHGLSIGILTNIRQYKNSKGSVILCMRKIIK